MTKGIVPNSIPRELQGDNMSKIIKWLFYLIVTGALGLIIFAYLGHFFGFDFTPEEKTIIIPVEIHEK